MTEQSAVWWHCSKCHEWEATEADRRYRDTEECFTHDGWLHEWHLCPSLTTCPGAPGNPSYAATEPCSPQASKGDSR